MGSIMKTVFGSGSESQNSSQSSGDPIKQEAFALAKPLLTSTLSNGQTVLNNIMANPAYTGQRVASLNPFQISSANNLGTFSNNTANNPYMTMGAGNANLVNGAMYGANAANIFNQYSGADPTQSILGNANQYANNPYINGLIDASSRDVVRNLYENDIPGINRAASGTGNMNSTRAGVQSAIAQRGAGDRLADLSSQIRSQFFGKGLDMAQNQYNQNLQNSLAANSQLYNAANLGNTLINSGQSQATTNFNQGQNAGAMFQTQNQNELNANKAQFDESQQNLLRALATISGVANGGTGWSGGPTSTSGTSSTVNTPSIASVAGSLLKSFF